MTRIVSLRSALAASVCLLPLQAFAQSNDNAFDVEAKPTTSAAATQAAQPNNWVDLGAQYQSGKSYFLNRYTGGVDKGLYGLGDFQIQGRDPWDSGGTKYYDMEGHNLGFDDRSLSMKFGQQGTWGVTLDYNGIPYYANDQFKTIFQSNGSLVPGVKPGGLGVTYTPLQAAQGKFLPVWLASPTNSPSALLQNQDLYLQRDVLKGTGKYQYGDWTISGAFRHEHKEGYQANSVELGGGGSPTSSSKTAPATYSGAVAYFAQPIDYDTDRYDVTAAYGTQQLQVQAGYTYSQFTDNNAVFDAVNPFGIAATTGSLGAGIKASSLTLPWVQPPSNASNQVRLLVGYNLTPTTRLNGNFQYGIETQNTPFVAGAGDPLASLNPGLPRSSFDGRAETIDANLALTAAPIDHLDLRLAYTINSYDNKSPQNSYDSNTRSTVSGDGGGGDCDITGLCVNLPLSYEHQTISAEAGYRISPETKVSLSDTYETMHRTYADTSLVTTNTVTGKVRSSITDGLFGTLSVSHQDRTAHNYNFNQTWLDMGASAASIADPTVAAGAPSNFLMYFESSRTHDDIKASLDFAPLDNVNGTLFAKFSNDRYPSDSMGLRNNHNLEIGPDVSWQVSSDISAHAFYTFQQIYYDQTSLYSTGGYTVPWQAKSTDSVQTVGATVDWQAIKDVLSFGFDYNFSYGDTAYALGDSISVVGSTTSAITNATLTMQPLPDVTSTMNMISLHGEYKFNPNMSVIFGYSYERFDYKDFMYSPAVTQYGNALLPGVLVPNESIQTAGAALRIRF